MKKLMVVMAAVVVAAAFLVIPVTPAIAGDTGTSWQTPVTVTQGYILGVERVVFPGKIDWAKYVSKNVGFWVPKTYDNNENNSTRLAIYLMVAR
jgi:hypothetical protein